MISVIAPKGPLLRQTDLFRSCLANLVDHNYELVVLADTSNWNFFDDKFGSEFFDDTGRPALWTRMMMGLQYLKYMLTVTEDTRAARAPYFLPMFYCRDPKLSSPKK